jgi:hypothetical protein
MPEYRLYILDARNCIEHRFDFVASDDELAVIEAATRYPYADWELWEGDRLLRRSARAADTPAPPSALD